MTDRTQRHWPWWEQALDVIAALLGTGIGVSMAYRNSYPLLAVVLVAGCIGKIGSTQLIRVLMGRWDEKP